MITINGFAFRPDDVYQVEKLKNINTIKITFTNESTKNIEVRKDQNITKVYKRLMKCLNARFVTYN